MYIKYTFVITFVLYPGRHETVHHPAETGIRSRIHLLSRCVRVDAFVVVSVVCVCVRVQKKGNATLLIY